MLVRALLQLDKSFRRKHVRLILRLFRQDRRLIDLGSGLTVPRALVDLDRAGIISRKDGWARLQDASWWRVLMGSDLGSPECERRSVRTDSQSYGTIRRVPIQEWVRLRFPENWADKVTEMCLQGKHVFTKMDLTFMLATFAQIPNAVPGNVPGRFDVGNLLGLGFKRYYLKKRVQWFGESNIIWDVGETPDIFLVLNPDVNSWNVARFWQLRNFRSSKRLLKAV